ncbi:site-specific integrase [Paenibacillus sp. CGMCC 1.16610]|uniref:Tyrosine-type recombinase/integrase n=1 Tax=Paenibacillus anseongense TaxID=2682845 RepID=A0ABW9U2K1_9BACL|nr:MULTISPECIES: site-specific integrase [Paenibacillus]MBA2943179.1 site-specific integrase [Paenibacillus sp. CGMCC 1.16610]MVQ33676.1 tyrosine-type recombinase/integrase [Paenibacillus anseongense]
MAYFTKVSANNKQGYKWVCVIDGPTDPATGKRNQISRRGDTKKDAEKRAQEALEKVLEFGSEGTVLKNQPFDKLSAEWLETYAKGKVKKSTVRVREKEINILNRYIAKTYVDKIIHKSYQKILNDLDNQGYARTTIEGVHTTANMIFKYSIKNKVRKDNPCTGAVIPVKMLTVEEIENITIEEKYLERIELKEFLAAAREHGLPQDTEIFYLLAFSGMRSGELCALKWSDINFEANEIRVTKTLYNPQNNMKEYELTPPKTSGSIRNFNIDESVLNLLKAHQKKQAKFNMKHRQDFKDFHDKHFVFCRDNGYPYIQKSILNRMERILKKTKITKKATPHIFRHTHISMLSEAEVDLKTIMRRVGHDDPETTMKIYTHVTEKMRKDADEKIKIHFGDILGALRLQEM